MALDILFPAKDYCNRNSKTKFDRSNDIINNKKYDDDDDEEEEEEEEDEETKKKKKKKKRRIKRRKLGKLFLPDLETQMRGGHEQQPQIAWETVVNDVKKLVIWLDLGMLYLCPFSHPLIFQRFSPFLSSHRYM